MNEHGLDQQAITKTARAELVKRVLIAVTALMVAAAIVIMLVAVYRIGDVLTAVRETQQSGSPAVKAATRAAESAKTAAEASTETNDQILDCLNPTGECFKESQRRTADFGRLQVLAVVCATGIDATLPFDRRLALVNECVTEGLKSES